MNENLAPGRVVNQEPDLDVGRRNLLKLTGAGVAALGAMSVFSVPFAKAQDTSNGANNFYTSDRVTVQKVAFKNQYQMNVAGNFFTPNDLDRTTANPTGTAMRV